MTGTAYRSVNTLGQGLKDRVVIVTGGSRGIGREIVLGAAALGARVVFCARTIGQAAHSVDEEATRLAGPGRVLAVQADVGCESDVEGLFDATLRAFGRVDVLVNNAGISREALLISLPGDQWDHVIATNLTGAFLMSRGAIREFLKQGGEGTIVSIGSVMQHGAPSNASYAASKGGLAGLTQAIAREYGAQGVGAYLLVVGAVETELTRDVPEALKRMFVDACPQKRQAQTGEVAAICLFLASRSGGLSNGKAIHVSGGLRDVYL